MPFNHAIAPDETNPPARRSFRTQHRHYFSVSVVCAHPPGAGHGDLIKPLAAIVGGRGGGKPELAQAGGPDADKIEALLQAVPAQLKNLLV